MPTAAAAPSAPPPILDPRAVAVEHRLGLALAAGAAVLFGTSYVATKLALVAFSPVAIGAWRGLGAVLLSLVVLRARGAGSLRLPVERGRLLRLAALGLLGGPGLIIGMNLAVAAIGATVAAFVAGLYAVLAAVFAPIVLRERLGPAALLGFLAALVGAGLLADLEVGSVPLAGVAAGLGGAVSYALYLVLSRRWAARPGGVAPGGIVTLAMFAMASIVLVPATLATDPAGLAPRVADPVALLAIAWLVVFPSVLANVMIQWSVRRVAARRTSSLLLLNPISASILSALLLGERLSPPQTAGAALVIAGIAISNGLVRLPDRHRPGGAAR